MTAEVPSAAAPPDQVRFPAAVEHPSRQHQCTEPISRGHRAPMQASVDPERDDPAVINLVTRARDGDRQAWDALIERYAPLVWSICRRHRLGDADAADVGRSVWLQLADQLDMIRDPAALPGWLASVTRQECLRVLDAARAPLTAGHVVDAETFPAEQVGTAEQELLVAEFHAALREAFRDLPECDQRLILVLIKDPPVPDAEISARLDIPADSIRLTRARCLDKLRRHPAIAALINTDSGAA